MNFNLPAQPNQQHRGGERDASLLQLQMLPEPPLPRWQARPTKATPAAATTVTPPPSRPRVYGVLWYVLFVLACSVLCYYYISRFVVAAVVVQGRSMAPTLTDGNRYLLNRWILHCRNPKAGDLVVLRDPGHDDYAVKRIIGTPHDVIQITNGTVFINGAAQTEAYLLAGTQTFLPNPKDGLIVLGAGQYFVLGDNRANSEDSRIYGAVPRDYFIGVLAP